MVDQSRKNIPHRSKSLFAVKTVKIQFGPPVPDVFHYMWAGGMWAGSRSGYNLATCRYRQEVPKQKVCQGICLPVTGPDGKYGGCMSANSLCKM